MGTIVRIADATFAGDSGRDGGPVDCWRRGPGELPRWYASDSYWGVDVRASTAAGARLDELTGPALGAPFRGDRR